MKKTYIILTFLYSITIGAFAQNDAMYVFRNDGQLDAFLRTSIDSITYSHYDKDSVYHDTWQTQLVYTHDSVYQIPLANIEKVDLVTPEPVYKPNVVNLSESLSNYIIECSSNSITFSSDISTNSIPQTGQIVVTSIDDESVAAGFSGRVTSVTTNSKGIICECESVGLSDIYERLLVVGQAESYTDNTASLSRAKAPKIGKDINFPMPSNISRSQSIEKTWGTDLQWDIHGGFSFELSQPSITLNYIICIGDENLKDFVRFKSRLKSEGNLSINAGIKGGFSPDPWFPVSIPFNVYGIAGALDFGFFIQESGSLDLSASLPFHFDTTNGFEYTEDEGFVEYPENPKKDAGWGKPEWSFNIDGEIFFGVASRLSLGIIRKEIASVDITAYVGPKISGSCTLASSQDGISDTMYKLLSNEEISSSLTLSIEPGYRVWFKDRESFGANLEFKFLEKSYMILPSIDGSAWEQGSNGTGTLTANVYNDTFFPVKIGWGIYDGDVLKQKHYFSDNYHEQEKWNNPTLIYNVNNLPKEYNYKAYPIVKLFDIYEMRVPDYATMYATDKKVAHVTTGNNNIKFLTKASVDVSVSGLQYLTSSYKLGVVYGTKEQNLTVGYASNVKYIEAATDGTYTIDLGTLEKFSTKYYYRACLVTNDSIYYGDIKSFTTRSKITSPTPGPIVDLGLSVKWASSNIGTTDPFDQGLHYAWGETETKSIYTKDNYDKHDWNILLGNKPECISGTALDAATVNMGDKWRMPTVDDYMELARECQVESLYTGFWGTERAEGFLVIGPNGNSIFLPYGGMLRDGEYINSSYYYTGSLREYDFVEAFYITGAAGLYRCVLMGYEGAMIRPVYGDLPDKSE